MIYSSITESFFIFTKNSHFLFVMLISSALILSLGGLFGMHTFILVSNLSTLEMNQLLYGNPFMHKRSQVIGPGERRQTGLMRLFGV
jgi:hypothetical protein